MNQKLFFTPGPSQLYSQVDQYIAEAIRQDYTSISHRSEQFKKIYQRTDEALRSLISLPQDHYVLFTGSASEIWGKTLRNCVHSTSFHFVNGAFSDRFYRHTLKSNKKALVHKVPHGCGYRQISDITIPKDVELITVAQNETSSGVQISMEDLLRISRLRPEALLSVDMVSSMPYPILDYSLLDSVYFSVQKLFGLPAGLGVWIVNDRMIEKAKQLQLQGQVIGPHHELPDMAARSRSYQTPTTPNVLAIYVLGRVCMQMLSQGIDTIRNEIDAKMDYLHKLVDRLDYVEHGVPDPSDRSHTILVLNSEIHADLINAYLEPQGMEIGSGYGEYKDTQIRIANFPSTSMEDIQRLGSALLKFG